MTAGVETHKCFRALSQSGVCTIALARGHNRADSRIIRAHHDVASEQQQGCGSDQFNSFFLQRRYGMETILIVLLVLFLLGGGGWGYSRWRG
jgi:hypothetical protein